MAFDRSPYLLEAPQRYLRETVPAEPPGLARIREACARRGLPAVSPETGATLRALAAASGGRRTLEIGCLLGYSAAWIASGLAPGGLLETIEVDAAFADEAADGLRRAGVAESVSILRGAALDVLPRLSGPYDLVFLDAAKEEYLEYLEHALRLLRPGGIVAADNVLWGGQVWDPDDGDARTVGIRRFTKAILSNPNLATTLLPVGDGLSVSVLLP